MDYQTIIAGLIPSAVAAWLMYTHYYKSRHIEKLDDELYSCKLKARQLESEKNFKDRNYKAVEKAFREKKTEVYTLEKHVEQQDKLILEQKARISFLKQQTFMMSYTPQPIITRADLDQHSIRIYLDEFEKRQFTSEKLDKIVQMRAAELIARHIKPEYETVREEGGKTRTTINYLFKQI